jgi:hypothetical protein
MLGYNYCGYHFNKLKPSLQIAIRLLDNDLLNVFKENVTDAHTHPSGTPDILPEIARVKAELLQIVSDDSVPFESKQDFLLKMAKILSFYKDRSQTEENIKEMIKAKIDDFKEQYAVYFFAIWHLRLRSCLGNNDPSLRSFEAHLVATQPILYDELMAAISEISAFEKQKREPIAQAVAKYSADIIDVEVEEADGKN